MTTPSRRDFLTAAGTMVTAGLAAGAGIPLAPPDKQPPHLPIPSPAKPRVGFAVVGLGELALEEILPAFALCDGAAPVALVSGHPDKAQKVANHYGINPKYIYNYDNYDTLRDNPDVSAIYIVLPNSMHADFTIRGFAAGKHVLCEKPMSINPEECQRMIDAGKKAGKKLMIAYRLHYEPFNRFVIEFMKKKELGKPRVFSAENLQFTKAPNIRLSKSTGGGPLGDVGIYCINAARYAIGEEPIEVTGQSWSDPNDERFAEVPSTVMFTLRFPSGALAHCSGGFDSARSDRFRITCEKGYVQLDPAFDYRGQRLLIGRKDFADLAESVGSSAPINETMVNLTPENHFAREMDHFAECITKDTEPLTPGEEGLRDHKIMAAIQEAMDTGKTVKVSV